MSDMLIDLVLFATGLMYLQFLVVYLWTFPAEKSLTGWSLLTSGAGWAMLMLALLVDRNWYDFPPWLWLALVAPPVLLGGILKNLLINEARRDAQRRCAEKREG